MKQFNLDLGITVNVFSSTSIKDAPPRLKETMEDVAGRVEELSKSKITTAAPPQPFRKRKTQSITKYADWDVRQYATDGKTSREKRAQQRHIRVFGMQKLGMNEYRKLMQEIDQMTDPDVDVMAMVNKRIKEIRERLDAEEKEKVEGQRRQIRSRTEKAGTSTTTMENVETRKTTGGKKPKQKGGDTVDESRTRVDTRKTTGAKKPKQKDGDTVDESRTRVDTRKTTGAKKPKQKDGDTVDESRSHKKEGIKQKPTSLKAKTTEQSKRKVVTMAEDVDEDEQDLVIIERKKADVEDFDDDDDDDYVPELDEDDDFDIPPPRARKTTQIVDKKADEELEDLADFVDRTFRKTTRKSTTKKPTAKKRRVGESTDDTEATIPLFQQIVGKNYEIMASEEVEEQMDRSINPTEAAGFRATMKSLAVALKEAVKKGKDVEATYKDLIKSTIEVARAMRYPGAFTVEAEEIFKAIPDLKCNAWRKYIKGDEMMDPKDVVLDEDEEEQDDLLIQGPVLGEESTQAAAKAIHNLPELLKRDAKANLVKLFDNQMKAHQYAAEACKNLKELHKTLPLEVFLRIADSAMRPLVIMHIPSTEAMCTKMREAAEAKTKKTTAGASRVKDVMEDTNLPQLQKDWTLEETYKARKMIACIIYKYVRDAMYDETTATHVVVEKFHVKQTTIHRQLYGKKYPGGGQTLKQMKERTSKTEKQATTTRPVESSKISGQKKVTLEKTEVTTSKGKGKGKKSQVKRSAEELRSASTSEVEKLRAKKRKAEESKIIEEEDEDRPTAEEIKRSKPPAMRRGLFIH